MYIMDQLFFLILLNEVHIHQYNIPGKQQPGVLLLALPCDSDIENILICYWSVYVGVDFHSITSLQYNNYNALTKYPSIPGITLYWHFGCRVIYSYICF